jgi:hypothetical protein
LILAGHDVKLLETPKSVLAADGPAELVELAAAGSATIDLNPPVAVLRKFLQNAINRADRSCGHDAVDSAVKLKAFGFQRGFGMVLETGAKFFAIKIEVHLLGSLIR